MGLDPARAKFIGVKNPMNFRLGEIQTQDCSRKSELLLRISIETGRFLVPFSIENVIISTEISSNLMAEAYCITVPESATGYGKYCEFQYKCRLSIIKSTFFNRKINILQ